jgi:hypothetical protein
VTAARTELPRPGDRLPLGKSGLHVSPLCLGMVTDPATVSAAFDAGVSFFFLSADMHWPHYEGTRRGLADLLRRGGGVRDEIVIGATCYVTQPEFCRYPFSEVLEAVPILERIDVVIAGGAYGHEIGTRVPVLAHHRQTGFVGARALGITFHDRAAARQALADGVADIVFARYNAKHPGARHDLFPHVGPGPRPLLFNFNNTAGAVGRSRAELGLPEDFWLPEIDEHYRFALSRPELDGILCAPQTPQQLAALLAALERGPLDPEEEEHFLLLAELEDEARARGG